MAKKSDAQKAAEKAVKKSHPATLILAILFLIVGAVAGVVLSRELTKNDKFELIGEKQVAYMVDKFQSYPALTQQIQDGYEYYQFFDDGEFCGYCGIHPEGGKLFLSKLYIRKEFRGRHLATKVFEFLKVLCKERGYSAIWLTCNKHNDGSLAVYRHLGFETTDTQEADIGGGFIMDDYIMEYKL